MPGEQEQANEYFLRLAVKGGLKFTRSLQQVLHHSKDSIKNKLDERGGEKKYKVLKKSKEPLKHIDISHVKDWDRFDDLAKQHKIQYAITEDPNNPEKEFFWFKARNEDEINTFLAAVLEFSQELDQELEQGLSEDILETPEELIRKKKQSQETKEDTKYKFHEQSFEDHEYKVNDFTNFDDLKAYVADTYDHKLQDLDISINSFNEVNSIKELEDAVSKLDKNEVRVWIERDPILKDMSEKEFDPKEPSYKLFEHSIETKEIKINDFQSLEQLKIHLGIIYKDEFNAAGINSESLESIKSIEELNGVLSKLDPSKINLKAEIKEPVKESTEKEFNSKEPKFKLYKQSSESNEQTIVDFNSFSGLKEHLTKNYQDQLKSSSLGIESFEDISSTKEMNDVLSRLGSSDIQLKVERKPLIKEFSEKEKQAKERKEPKDKVNIKETNYER